jgi:hypothetical protein
MDRLSAAARLRGFPLVGWGGEETWRHLRTNGRIEPTPAPHDADLLVCLGALPESWRSEVVKLYETLPLPRAAVHFGDEGGGACEGLPGIVRATTADLDDGLTWSRIAAARGDRTAANNRPLLEDRPPAPWRGIGPHGQGGEGMMGGKPYGRPMAMTAEDPDQLTLDDVPTALGPFFPGLPSGLRLVLQVQGDRVRTVTKVENRFPPSERQPRLLEPTLAPAAAVLAGEEVTIAALEQARLRAHLNWAANLLAFCGLDVLGKRFARAATAPPDAGSLRSLFGAAERACLRFLLQGVGRISRDAAERRHLVGPLARASGIARDARAEDPAYAAAGFTCLTQRDGDCWARWCQRRDECFQACALIERAGARLATAPEAPGGALRRRGAGRLAGASAANLTALEESLPGLEWFAAVLFVASLGLDMQEAALR